MCRVYIFWRASPDEHTGIVTLVSENKDIYSDAGNVPLESAVILLEYPE